MSFTSSISSLNGLADQCIPIKDYSDLLLAPPLWYADHNKTSLHIYSLQIKDHCVVQRHRKCEASTLDTKMLYRKTFSVNSAQIPPKWTLISGQTAEDPKIHNAHCPPRCSKCRVKENYDKKNDWYSSAH